MTWRLPWLLSVLLTWSCAEGPLRALEHEDGRLATPRVPDAPSDGIAVTTDPAPGPDREPSTTVVDDPLNDTEPEPGPPVCTDDLAADGLVAGPAGLMIQVPSITDICALQRALDHVCRAHQDDIHDLVLTSVELWSGGEVRAELDLEVLDAIAPYLDCFDNVFVGTVSEILLAAPYSAATITDADSRWRWLGAAKRVAELVSDWMDANYTRAWHWYVSYEANLNAFTDVSYRNAYIALLQQHITDLTVINSGVVAWSPTFWTAARELGANGRTSLQSALSELFERVPVDWVLLQDHLGAQPQWVCSDALAYYDIVRAAGPNLASVQLNVEYFTIADGNIRSGDAGELATRVDCYRAAGASVGASFELRYWYLNHGH